MYVAKRRGRGFGQADLSSWGFVSPCGGSTSSSATSAAPGQVCAPAATFPWFGMADSSGNCQPADPTMTLAAGGVILLLLYGVFQGGRR
jgi:hypothetical protein